jgi:alkanesulfonate monooxygenase SsuD/methylene tetrahydromethanopterin reductase-like flavin-dependent oxidoreductase (luciferase family)
MAAQVAVYLRPPGYGEMFTELGFGSLVDRAREGARRSELAPKITAELLGQVCAVGSEGEIRARLASYRDAGATSIGIAPTTAEDPAGRRMLAALGPRTSEARAA